MKEVIDVYHCDVCGKESDPELMIHTSSGKDVCAECLEKLVDEHFAREKMFDEIIESVDEKKPLKSRRTPACAGHNRTDLSDDDVRQIIEDHKNGISIKKLKDKYKISYDRLRELLGPEKKYNTAKVYDWEEAQRLRDEGVSIREIAIRFGCSDQNVHNHTITPECRKQTWRKKSEKTKKTEPRHRFDWGKAQALRNAGWSMVKIASELGCSDQAVANNTVKPAQKEVKELEWVDDDIARLAEKEYVV